MSPGTKSSEARAPVYGLRLTIGAGKVMVRTLDSRGRGRAVGALFVPVVQMDERLRVDANSSFVAILDEPATSSTASPPTRKTKIPRELSKKLVPEEEDLVAPRLFAVPLDKWPSSEQILVLLLYDQSEGIGGGPRPPRTTGENSSLADLIEEALDCDSLSELRGGLIRQEPARQASAADAEVVRFAVASCQYPSDIFNRMPSSEHATRGPVDASLLALGDRLNQPDPPTLLLMCGDQVYTDATAGLFDPKVSDQRFRIPHERRGQSRGSMAVMQRLGLTVQMMLDDHEIRDNWAPNDPDPEQLGSGKTTLELGKSAYFTYERGLQVDPMDVWRTDVWHTIDHRGLKFFVGDTRTERDARTVLNWRDARIMYARQFEELCKWLVTPEHANRPKFVLTASALLPRRLSIAEHPAHALHSEGWEGYPASMHALLKFICDNEVKGVIFLSGDDHLSNLVTATVTNDDEQKRCTLYSVHSSGLYSPYPVANGVPEDFKGDDSFCFPDSDSPGKSYRCDVQTKFAPCDGFAVLTARGGQSGWSLDVEFQNADGVKQNGSYKGLPL